MKTLSKDIRYEESDPKITEAQLALEILGFLVSDPKRLTTFLDETGVDPNALRDALGDRALHGGLLDYIMTDEALLVAFAASANRSPEAIEGSIAKLRRTTLNGS